MNKAFKVLWNDVRRSYVVSSEAQMSHGKPARSSKTLVAAAVAGVLALGASSAFAALPDPITNDSFRTDLDTTKFHSGNGYVNIQTEGDARKLLKALLSKNLGEIQGALGFDGQYATLVGTAGGQSYFDQKTSNLLDLPNSKLQSFIEKILEKKPELKPILDKVVKLNEQFRPLEESKPINVSGSTEFIVGGEAKNPLIVASVGADRVINAGLGLGFSFGFGSKSAEPITLIRKGNSSVQLNSGNSVLLTGASSAINIGNIANGKASFGSKSAEPITLIRKGNSSVQLNSGNSVLLTGASSAINIGNIANGKASIISIKPSAQETNVTLDGNSNVTLSGSTSSLATVTAGSALALGGKATSTLTGNSHLVINTKSQGQGFEGLTVGATGGGLAVGLFGGEGISKVEGTTTIDVQSGLSAGLLGGGVALGGQISKPVAEKLINKVIPENYRDNIVLTDEFYKGGSATTSSQDIAINLGKNASSAFEKLINKVIPENYRDNIVLTDEFYKGGSATTSSQDIAINLGKNASSAFVVGGGLAAAYQYDSAEKSANATATAGDVSITIGEKDAAPVFASVEEKSKYFAGIKTGLKALKDVKADNITDKEKDVVALIDTDAAPVFASVEEKSKYFAGIKTGLKALKDVKADNITDKEKDVVALIDTIASEPGVNVGVMGGGIAASWSRNEHYPNSENNADALTAPNALATVGDVVMDVFSGYNVGLVGGGLAAASGDANGTDKPAATLAESTADSVTMNFVGGETIGVMGGGIAVAAGTGDMNYGVGAVSHVGTVNLNVAGGSVRCWCCFSCWHC